MIIITIPMTLIDSDTEVQQLAMGAVLKGANPAYKGSDVIYPIESAYMPLDYAMLLVSKGATVENIPLYIEVDPADAVVPASLVTATDEEGEPVSQTWGEWCNATHSVVERDGRFFVGSNANSNADLSLNILLQAGLGEKLLKPSEIPASPEPEPIPE